MQLLRICIFFGIIFPLQIFGTNISPNWELIVGLPEKQVPYGKIAIDSGAHKIVGTIEWKCEISKVETVGNDPVAYERAIICKKGNEVLESSLRCRISNNKRLYFPGDQGASLDYKKSKENWFQISIFCN